MNKRILVVDDTKNIRAMITTFFELDGYTVDSAANGLEALEFARNNLYSMVFLDVKMPGMSGTEVLKELRILQKDTPVVIMTAYATVKNAVDCTRIGAVEYLRKPFTVQKIKEVVKQVLMSRQNNSDNNLETYDMYLKYAYTHVDNGNIEEAKKQLRTAISMNVDCEEAYILLGSISEKEGSFEKAEKYYKIAYDLNMDNPQALAGLTRIKNHI